MPTVITESKVVSFYTANRGFLRPSFVCTPWFKSLTVVNKEKKTLSMSKRKGSLYHPSLLTLKIKQVFQVGKGEKNLNIYSC